MKLIDRALLGLVLLIAAGVVLPVAVPPLVTLVVVVTACLVVLQAVRHYIGPR
jgi:hypothetical protein